MASRALPPQLPPGAASSFPNPALLAALTDIIIFFFPGGRVTGEFVAPSACYETEVDLGPVSIENWQKILRLQQLKAAPKPQSRAPL